MKTFTSLLSGSEETVLSKPSSDEDYLDNLLNSITHARTDSDNATSAIRKRQEAKAKARRSIDPNEDFMEATGIDGFTSKPVSHNNLRRALSEDDFLKQFEEELSESDSDDFLKQFDDNCIINFLRIPDILEVTQFNIYG